MAQPLPGQMGPPVRAQAQGPRRTVPQQHPARSGPPIQYTPLRGGGKGGAEEADCCNLRQLFFEPEGEVKATNWVHVGKGRGKYEAQREYKYVGEGAGAYSKEEVVAPPPKRKLRTDLVSCCVAASIAIIATLFLIASSRLSSSPAREEVPAQTAAQLPAPVAAQDNKTVPKAAETAIYIEAQHCLVTGQDCRDISCCRNTSMRCYEKDTWWATCLPSCTPGIHEADSADFRTPWSCKDLTWELPPSALDAAAQATSSKCAATGANCNQTHCCQDPALRCFEHNEYWAECLPLQSCVPGLHGTDPSPWTCKDLSGVARAELGQAAAASALAAAQRQGGAAAGDEPRGGEALHEQDDGLPPLAGVVHDAALHLLAAGAGATAGAPRQPLQRPEGQQKALRGPSSPESAGAEQPGPPAHADGAMHIVKSASHHRAPKTEAVGQTGFSVDASCSAPGQNCQDTRCCTEASSTCFEHGPHWAECLRDCTPGVHQADKPEHQTPWSCAILGRQEGGAAAPPTQRRVLSDGPAGGLLAAASSSSAAAPALGPYNCTLDSASSPACENMVLGWSLAHMAWCCKYEAVACPWYNCTGTRLRWSKDHEVWCSQHSGDESHMD